MGATGRAAAGSWLVVGLDNGGNTNNSTILSADGRFLVDKLVETPSRVQEGPGVAIEALVEALDNVLALVGTSRVDVAAVGLDTPGPASAAGVLSRDGCTNFAHPGWRGFDIRTALEERTGLPVVYNNDGNAAALYAHYSHFGGEAEGHSSVAAIVGTGLGGGVVVGGSVVRGVAGMAGELGHVHIPMEGLLQAGQPVPRCNCGFTGDVESVASLTGIEQNLLPYWLGRYEGHELGAVETLSSAAKAVRSYGEQGDPMARRIFEQQAIAIGRLFTVCANVLDPSAYFVGGGVLEAAPEFRDWYLAKVREHTVLRREQADLAVIEVVPELDMAGARGSAVAALDAVARGVLPDSAPAVAVAPRFAGPPGGSPAPDSPAPGFAGPPGGSPAPDSPVPGFAGPPGPPVRPRD